jgi:hypothetical protein
MSSGSEDIWNKVRDFANLPPTPESRDALLSEVPIQSIAGLLVHDAHADVVCRCLFKLVGGGEDEKGLQILSSPQGQELLHAGLQHSNKIVRSMTISLIRGASGFEEGLAFVRQQGLLQMVARAIVDRELSVSSAASAALLHVVNQPHGGPGIVFDDCGKLLEAIMSEDEQHSAEFQLRALELLAQIWSSSEKAAELCRDTQAKRRLEDFLDSEDVLLQLNAVEVLALLPPFDVQKLMPKLLSTAEEVTGGAVPARLLECVAKFIAENKNSQVPTHDDARGKIATRLCALLCARLQTATNHDLVDVVSAVATLCSTSAGFCALARSADYPHIIASLPSMAQSLQESLRLSSLCALGNALSSAADARSSGEGDVGDNSDAHGGHLGRASTSLVNFLFRLAKSPIHEERVAALHTLKGLCQHAWGMQAALCVEGFLAHVMDRSMEISKRAIEEKYQVALAISSHAMVKDLVGTERAALLAALVAQGPYGTHTNSAVKEAIPVVATQKAS